MKKSTKTGQCRVFFESILESTIQIVFISGQKVQNDHTEQRGTPNVYSFSTSGDQGTISCHPAKNLKNFFLANGSKCFQKFYTHENAFSVPLAKVNNPPLHLKMVMLSSLRTSKTGYSL